MTLHSRARRRALGMFIALALVTGALAACSDPTGLHGLTCNRRPYLIIGRDTSWIVWSPVWGYPCK